MQHVHLKKPGSRWFVGAGFVAGVAFMGGQQGPLSFLPTSAGVTTSASLSATATHPSSSPQPTEHSTNGGGTPHPTSHPTSGPTSKPTAPPTAPHTAPPNAPPAGTSTGSQGGIGEGRGAPHHEPTSAPSAPPSTAHGSPTPSPSTATKYLLVENFQEALVGTTPAMGGGAIVAEGTNHFLRVGEAHTVIGKPGWMVTDVAAAVRGQNGIPVIGATDGTTTYLCGLVNGAVYVARRSGSEITNLAKAPYATDGAGGWERLHLEVRGGAVTCTAGRGKAVVHSTTALGFSASAAVLEGRINQAGGTIDFDDIGIAGSIVTPAPGTRRHIGGGP